MAFLMFMFTVFLPLICAISGFKSSYDYYSKHARA